MKFRIVSLGCPKNLVESEYIVARLEASGHTMSDEADVAVINTCAFIADSAKESIETILEEAKRKGSGGKVVVTGCLVERYQEKLQALLPEVELFVGRNYYPHMGSLVEKAGFFLREGAFAGTYPRRILTRPPTAYLKIQEGCNNRCTYCTVPSIRGGLQSRDMSAVRDELRWLLAQGFREINVIGQDITSYGRDSGTTLKGLLRELLTVKGDYFLRLLYMHPRWVSDDLIDLMAGEERILPYVDIPIQHSEDAILKAMNRGYGRADLERLLVRLRERIAGVVLRTSIIVGFPGESHEDFKDLCLFVTRFPFDNLGAFMYSREEGTHAYRMKGQVRKGEKKRRFETLMELQGGISKEQLERRVGTETMVIIEEEGNEFKLGRAMFQAPDIDGLAFVKGDCRIGEIRRAKIVKTLDYDVIVEVAP
jgi:ribosomal protein S12 methylthiotransferase